jgi:hypothetical protein
LLKLIGFNSRFCLASSNGMTTLIGAFKSSERRSGIADRLGRIKRICAARGQADTDRPMDATSYDRRVALKGLKSDLC